MKTYQMTLDEKLISEVDRISKKMGMSRSAFTREALSGALKKIREREMEKKQRDGYSKKPVKKGEFTDFENEQVWID